MNILILGSGGREHTFAWKIAQSPLCKSLYVAPGNSGTAKIATNVNIGVTDFEAIKSFVLEKEINMSLNLARLLIDFGFACNISDKNNQNNKAIGS